MSSNEKPVLLVEDSATDAFAIGQMLRGQYPVVHVAHANHILDAVRQVNPGMVLMDIVLPGTSGFEATRLLKSQPDTKNIPVAICSTKEMATDQVWAGRCGADAYLTKPVNKASLLGVVRHLMGTTHV